MVEKFLFSTKNIVRSSYIWNTFSGVIDACQSVILLIVITRTNGLYDAGVFAIAYAIANLMLAIGKYGIRVYQVSDIKENYIFGDYLGARTVTCILMLIASIIYSGYGLVFGDYDINKFLVIMLVCVLKIVDAFEDAFHGNFQQKNRLDAAAKAKSLRMIVVIFVYTAALIITENLLISTIFSVIAAVTGFFIFTFKPAPQIEKINLVFSSQQIKGILKACFALFAGGFLIFYISNAPKYAIDYYLSEEDQACYNFIFMPVWVISLLSNFIFQPIMLRLAEFWNRGSLKKFRGIIIRQVVAVTGITSLCIIGAFLIGIPVLEFLYATELSQYRTELCILLFGGGMLAFSQFFIGVVTVIRRQKMLLWGYLLAAIAAKVFSGWFIINYKIMGASVLYTMLMSVLSLIFLFTMIIEIRKDIKEEKVQRSNPRTI